MKEKRKLKKHKIKEISPHIDKANRNANKFTP